MQNKDPAEKQKKKKIKYKPDDGRTVYSMENVGRDNRKDKDKNDIELTRKERRAAIRAALGYYLPRFLLVVGCFVLVGLLLYLWLL